MYVSNPVDIANQIKLEMDSRNPRLRLTVLTCLLDNGVPVVDVLERTKEIVAWVGVDLETLLSEFLEDTAVEEVEEIEVDLEKDVNEIAILKGQYL